MGGGQQRRTLPEQAAGEGPHLKREMAKRDGCLGVAEQAYPYWNRRQGMDHIWSAGVWAVGRWCEGGGYLA